MERKITELLRREREEFIAYHRKPTSKVDEENMIRSRTKAYEEMYARRENSYDIGLKKFPRKGEMCTSGEKFVIPDHLEPRVLSAKERTEVAQACRAEFAKKDSLYRSRMPMVLQTYADVSRLLNKPENHIKVASGQYVEKQIHVRPVHDMTDEMAQELSNLSRYHAYAKIIEEKGGKQNVWKGKIQTYMLPDELPTADEDLALCIKNGHLWSMKRSEVEAEIRDRQEPWRRVAAAQTPTTPQPPPTSEPPPTSD